MTDVTPQFKAKFDAMTAQVRECLKSRGMEDDFAVHPRLQEFLVHTAQATETSIDILLGLMARSYLEQRGIELKPIGASLN